MKVVLFSLVLAGLLGCNKTEALKPACQPILNANCACPQVIDPVCGCDGGTYGSPCEATCSGVTYTKGACK